MSVSQQTLKWKKKNFQYIPLLYYVTFQHKVVH